MNPVPMQSQVNEEKKYKFTEGEYIQRTNDVYTEENKKNFDT